MSVSIGGDGGTRPLRFRTRGDNNANVRPLLSPKITQDSAVSAPSNCMLVMLRQNLTLWAATCASVSNQILSVIVIRDSLSLSCCSVPMNPPGYIVVVLTADMWIFQSVYFFNVHILLFSRNLHRPAVESRMFQNLQSTSHSAAGLEKLVFLAKK